MERNNFQGLASIRSVSHASPIDGCDNIHLVRIDGWNVIATKDINVGDMIVYCEIDSILPKENPAFTFLDGKKIKTKKMKGVISQGIVFPLSVLPPEITPTIGLDVTQILEITKYESESDAEGNRGGRTESETSFPSFIIKTDENRVQNQGRMLQEILPLDLSFYVTEKLDGTSCTIYKKDGIIGVCSRNLQVKEFTSTGETNHYWGAYRQYYFDKILENLDNIVIQGEIVGIGIQNNKYRKSDKELFIFNIIDLNGYKRYDYTEIDEFCETHRLKHVPILDNNFKLPTENTIDELVKYSVGNSMLNPTVKREGVVIRSCNTDLPQGQISFKVINPEFLLKYE